MRSIIAKFINETLFGGVEAELEREMKHERGEDRYTVFYATRWGRLGVLRMGDEQFKICVEPRFGEERTTAEQLFCVAGWEQLNRNGRTAFIKTALSYESAGWELRRAIRVLDPVIVLSPYLRILFGAVAESVEAQAAIYLPLLSRRHDGDAVAAFIATATGDESGNDDELVFFLDDRDV